MHRLKLGILVIRILVTLLLWQNFVIIKSGWPRFEMPCAVQRCLIAGVLKQFCKRNLFSIKILIEVMDAVFVTVRAYSLFGAVFMLWKDKNLAPKIKVKMRIYKQLECVIIFYTLNQIQNEYKRFPGLL